MLERFFPDAAYQNIYDVDLNWLKENGISGLLLDIDNTLARPDAKKPGVELTAWLDWARECGFGICILSNAGRRRVSVFASELGVYAISKAAKPSKTGFQKALHLLDMECGQVCMIGDQLFTDVCGAKKSGIYAIYVRPIIWKEIFTVMLKRIPEWFVLWQYERRQKMLLVQDEGDGKEPLSGINEETVVGDEDALEQEAWREQESEPDGGGPYADQ